MSIGGTALLFASVKGHERVVETLCRRGADVRVQVPAASVGEEGERGREIRGPAATNLPAAHSPRRTAEARVR